MADRAISALPAAESQDLVDTALFHLVNTLRPDLSDRNRRATAAQLRALLVPDGSIGTAQLADDSVTNDKFRESAGLSVIGRGASSTGNPADLVASTDGHVLRRSGSTVGFGQIGAAALAPASVLTAALGTKQVTADKVVDGVLGSAPTSNGFGSTSIPAGGTATIPQGLWWVVVGNAIDVIVEARVGPSGWYRVGAAPISGAVNLAYLVASVAYPGSGTTSVRARNTGASAQALLTQRVLI